MQGPDVSAAVAGAIATAQVFTKSTDNIRCGKYRGVIQRIHAEAVKTQTGDQNFSFWVIKPIVSEPNPQFEGDRVDFVSQAQPGTGPLQDDGTKPNAVGVDCAMKLNFSKNAVVAGSNMKAAVMALFSMPGNVSDEDIFQTWMELALVRFVKKGEIAYVHPKTMQPVIAKRDLFPNPACGMIIDLVAKNHKKRTPNEFGSYVTLLNWSCAFPIGEGENAPDKVAERRKQIETAAAVVVDDDEAPAAPSAPPAAPPVAPPAPPAAFAPPAPWTKHDGAWGATPETRWFYSDSAKGGDGKTVKSEAQLRAGQ